MLIWNEAETQLIVAVFCGQSLRFLFQYPNLYFLDSQWVLTAGALHLMSLSVLRNGAVESNSD